MATKKRTATETHKNRVRIYGVPGLDVAYSGTSEVKPGGRPMGLGSVITPEQFEKLKITFRSNPHREQEE